MGQRSRLNLVGSTTSHRQRHLATCPLPSSDQVMVGETPARGMQPTHNLICYIPLLCHILFFRSISRACSILPEGIITGCKHHEVGITRSCTWLCCTWDLGSSLISYLFCIFTFSLLNIEKHRSFWRLGEAWNKKKTVLALQHIIVDDYLIWTTKLLGAVFSFSEESALQDFCASPSILLFSFNCCTKV